MGAGRRRPEEMLMLEGMMGGLTPAEFYQALVQIILLDLVLAGDNAVVIAMACRKLPPNQRMMGILLGAAVAIGMRIVFTIGVTSLLQTPWIMLIGAIALFWIAVKLLTDHGEAHEVESATGLWEAVRIVAIADLVMSLDNVIAIAAAAKGNWPLIIIGLGLSIPLIVFGATLVTWLLARLPQLLWIGAGLLGWIAGGMMVSDPAVVAQSKQFAAEYGLSYERLKQIASALGAAIVVVIALIIRARSGPADKPAH
jgi:YjbE family integral membrane protein